MLSCKADESIKDDLNKLRFIDRKTQCCQDVNSQTDLQI